MLSREAPMEKPVAKLKKCYVHSEKIAIAGCSRCGKPMCSICVKESPSPGMCPACSRADFASPENLYPEVTSQSEIFEITVGADDEPEARKNAAYSAFEQGGCGSLNEKSEIAVAHEGVAPVAEGKPIPASFSETQIEEKEQKIQYKESQTSALPVPGFQVDIPRQLLMGFGAGLAGGILTYALWLFLASVRNNWSQLAVLTAGIMIPWFLFKGTTAKKHLGIPVYRKSPPAIWMAIISILIMLALFPVAEYLAYKTAYVHSREGSALRGFISQKFRVSDIAIMVAGFFLSFGVPFFLKLGERPVPE